MLRGMAGFMTGTSRNPLKFKTVYNKKPCNYNLLKKLLAVRRPRNCLVLRYGVTCYGGGGEVGSGEGERLGRGEGEKMGI